MEDVRLTDYEALEVEASHNLTQNGETNNGTVKHNGAMGLLGGSHASQQATTF